MKLRLPHKFQAALLAALASVSFTTLSSGTIAVATGAALLAGQQAQANVQDQIITDSVTVGGVTYTSEGGVHVVKGDSSDGTSLDLGSGVTAEYTFLTSTNTSGGTNQGRYKVDGNAATRMANYGTIILANGTAGGVTYNGGQIYVQSNVTVANDLILGTSNYAESGWNGAIRMSGGDTFTGDVLFAQNAKLTVSGSNTFTGTVSGADKKLELGQGGTLTFAGNLTLKSLNAASASVVFSGSHVVISGSGQDEGIHQAGGTVTVGGGAGTTLMELGRLELGDATGGSSALNVANGATLKITGSTNGTNYKSNSFVLGEWNIKTAAAISGTVLSKDAEVRAGDNGGTINIAATGTLAAKGIRTAKSDTDNRITVNVNGGRLILGSTGILAQSLNAYDGSTIGLYADSANITGPTALAGHVTFDTQKYAFAADGNSVAHAASGTTAIKVTGNATIAGGAHLSEVGGGTVSFTGANITTGGVLSTSGAVAIGGSSSTVTLGGTITNSGSLTLAGNLAFGSLAGFEIYGTAAEGDFDGQGEYAGSGHRIGGTTQYYVVKGADGSSLDITGIASYSGATRVDVGSAKDLVVTFDYSEGDTTYYVNKDLAYNSGAMGSETRIAVTAGKTLSVGGSDLATVMSKTYGAGNVTVTAGGTITGGGSSAVYTTHATGTLTVKASQALTLGTNKGNQYLDFSSFSKVVLENGASIHVCQYPGMNFQNMTVASGASAEIKGDDTASANMDAVHLTGTTQIDGTLTLSAGWKYQMSIDKLKGSGTLVAGGGAETHRIIINGTEGTFGKLQWNNNNYTEIVIAGDSTVGTVVSNNHATNKLIVNAGVTLTLTGGSTVYNLAGSGTLALAPSANADYTIKNLDAWAGTTEIAATGGTTALYLGSGNTAAVRNLHMASGTATIRLNNNTAKAVTLGNVDMEAGTKLLSYYANWDSGNYASVNMSIGTLTMKGATATVGTTNHGGLINIGSIAGEGTLTLTYESSSDVKTVFNLGGAGVTGTTFSGTLDVYHNNNGSKRNTTLILNDAYTAANAVVQFRAVGAGSNARALGIGINAETVKVAGLNDGTIGTTTGNNLYSLYSGGYSRLDNKYDGGTNFYDKAGDGVARTLEITGAGTYSTAIKVLGNVNLAMGGQGTQTFSGDMGSFDGTLTVNSGTLKFTHANGITAAGLAGTGGTLDVTNTLTVNNAADNDFGGSLAVGGLTKTGAGELTLHGISRIGSAINLQAGSLVFGAGTYDLNGLTSDHSEEYSGDNCGYLTITDTVQLVNKTAGSFSVDGATFKFTTQEGPATATTVNDQGQVEMKLEDKTTYILNNGTSMDLVYERAENDQLATVRVQGQGGTGTIELTDNAELQHLDVRDGSTAVIASENAKELALSDAASFGSNAYVEVQDDAYLKLSHGGTAAAVLTHAKGAGTITLAANASLGAGSTTAATGTLTIADGKTLTLGGGDQTKVNISSFTQVVLDGGTISYNADESTINGLTVNSEKAGTLHLEDMGSKALVLGGDTVVDGTLTAMNHWNSLLTISHLTGDGTLVQTNGNAVQEMIFAINSLEGFTGAIELSHNKGGDTTSISTGSSDVQFRALTMNIGSHTMNFALDADATIGALTLTAGTANFTGAGTLGAGGVDGTAALNVERLAINVTEGAHTYTGTANIGKLTMDGEGTQTIGGTIAATDTWVLNGGTLVMTGTYNLDSMVASAHEAGFDGGVIDGNGFETLNGIRMVSLEGGSVDASGATFSYGGVDGYTMRDDGVVKVDSTDTDYSTFYILNNGDGEMETLINAREQAGEHAADFVNIVMAGGTSLDANEGGSLTALTVSGGTAGATTLVTDSSETSANLAIATVTVGVGENLTVEDKALTITSTVLNERASLVVGNGAAVTLSGVAMGTNSTFTVTGTGRVKLTDATTAKNLLLNTTGDGTYELATNVTLGNGVSTTPTGTLVVDSGITLTLSGNKGQETYLDSFGRIQLEGGIITSNASMGTLHNVTVTADSAIKFTDFKDKSGGQHQSLTTFAETTDIAQNATLTVHTGYKSNLKYEGLSGAGTLKFTTNAGDYGGATVAIDSLQGFSGNITLAPGNNNPVNITAAIGDAPVSMGVITLANGGNITATGSNTLTVAGLDGTAGSLTVQNLTIDVEGSHTYGGTLNVGGQLTKTGSGTQSLGTFTPAAPIVVSGGTLTFTGRVEIQQLVYTEGPRYTYTDATLTAHDQANGLRYEESKRAVYIPTGDGRVTLGENGAFTLGGQTVTVGQDGVYHSSAESADRTTLWVNTGMVNLADYASVAELTTAKLADAGTLNLGAAAAPGSIATLQCQEGSTTMHLAGVGSVTSGVGAGTLDLAAGARVTVPGLTVSGNRGVYSTGAGTLVMTELTLNNTASNVEFDSSTEIGTVAQTGGTITFGGGVTHNVTNLKLSQNGASVSQAIVKANTTLHITGTDVAYDNDHRYTASFLVSHWPADNTVDVYGTLISEAVISSCDGTGTINVEEGGRLELRDGLNRGKNNDNAITINVKDGATLVAGTTHNTEQSKNSGTMVVNMAGGSTFEAYYRTSDTTAEINKTLALGEGTVTINAGGADKTLQLKAGVTGTEASITKTGEGILELGASSSYTGSTTVNAGTLKTTHLGTGDITVNAGTLDLTGAPAITAGGNLTLTDGATLVLAGANMLTMGGELSLSGAVTFVLDNILPSTQGDYVLATGTTASITEGAGISVIWNTKPDYFEMGSVRVVDENKWVITLTALGRDLIWNGGEAEWSTAGDHWHTDSQDNVPFATGNKAIFATSEEAAIAIVNGAINASGVVVESGATVTIQAAQQAETAFITAAEIEVSGDLTTSVNILATEIAGRGENATWNIGAGSTVTTDTLTADAGATLTLSGEGRLTAGTITGDGTIVFDQGFPQPDVTNITVAEGKELVLSGEVEKTIAMENLKLDGTLVLDTEYSMTVSDTLNPGKTGLDLHIRNNGNLTVSLGSDQNALRMDADSTGDLHVGSGTISYLSELGEQTVHMADGTKLLFGLPADETQKDDALFSNDIVLDGNATVQVYGSSRHNSATISGNVTGTDYTLTKDDGNQTLTFSGVVNVGGLTTANNGNGTIVFNGGSGSLGNIVTRGGVTIQFSNKEGAESSAYTFDTFNMGGNSADAARWLRVDENVTVTGTKETLDKDGVACTIMNGWGIDGGGLHVDGVLNVGVIAMDAPETNYFEGTGIINTKGMNLCNGNTAYFQGGITVNITSETGIFRRNTGNNTTIHLADATLQAKDADWEFKDDGSNYTVTLDSATGTTFRAEGGHSIKVSKALGGTGKMLVRGDGSGTVMLNGANSFSGGLDVTGATVEMGHKTALGNANNAISIGQGGVIDLKGHDDTTYAYTLAGGTLQNTGGDTDTGHKQTRALTLTENSTVGGTGNFHVLNSSYNAATVTLDGHKLTKTGTNTVGFYTTTFDAGTLEVQGGKLDFANGGKGNDTFSGAMTIILNDATAVEDKASGTVNVNAGLSLNALESANMSLSTILASGTVLSASVEEGKTLTLTGNITGAGSVSKAAGDGTLVLAGTGNVITNQMTAAAGTLQFNGTFDVSALHEEGDVSYDGGTTVTNAGGFAKLGDIQLVTGEGALAVSGATFTVGQDSSGSLQTEGDKKGYITFANANKSVFYIMPGDGVEGKDSFSVANNEALQTISMANGTTLVADGSFSTSLIAVESGGRATLEITSAADGTQHVVTSDGNAKNITIKGDGMYVLTKKNDGSWKSVPMIDELDSSWTGTVKIANVQSWGNINLNTYGHTGSSVMLDNVTGYMAAATFNPQLQIGTGGFTLTDGSSGQEITFAGGVSGEGNFIYNLGNPNNMHFHFSGDVSGWTGSFLSNNAGKTGTLYFEGSATTVNAEIDRKSSTLHMQLGVNTRFNRDVAVNNVVAQNYSITLGSTNDSPATLTVAGSVQNLGGLVFDGDATHTVNLNGGGIGATIATIGSISGKGDINITSGNGTRHYNITGDVSDWTGTLTQTENSGSMYLSFSGTSELNANIINTANSSADCWVSLDLTHGMTVGGQLSYTGKGPLNVNVGNASTPVEVSFTNTVKAGTVNVAADSTASFGGAVQVGTASLANGANLEVNAASGSNTIGTLSVANNATARVSVGEGASATVANTNVGTGAHATVNGNTADVDFGNVNVGDNASLSVMELGSATSLNVSDVTIGAGATMGVYTGTMPDEINEASLVIASGKTLTAAGEGATLIANLELATGSKLDVSATGNTGLQLGSTLTLNPGMQLSDADMRSVWDLEIGQQYKLVYDVSQLIIKDSTGTVTGTYNPGQLTAENKLDAHTFYNKLQENHYYVVFTNDGSNVGTYAIYCNVPEPATSTLSLLALCALAARRRRKG